MFVQNICGGTYGQLAFIYQVETNDLTQEVVLFLQINEEDVWYGWQTPTSIVCSVFNKEDRGEKVRSVEERGNGFEITLDLSQKVRNEKAFIKSRARQLGDFVKLVLAQEMEESFFGYAEDLIARGNTAAAVEYVNKYCKF